MKHDIIRVSSYYMISNVNIPTDSEAIMLGNNREIKVRVDNLILREGQSGVVEGPVVSGQKSDVEPHTFRILISRVLKISVFKENVKRSNGPYFHVGMV